MKYDVMTYDAMMYDVMTYDFITYDVMTYEGWDNLTFYFAQLSITQIFGLG